MQSIVGKLKRENGEKFPAVVCVHGGGGTAFDEWVQKWSNELDNLNTNCIMDYYSFICYEESKNKKWLILTGVFFGCAISPNFLKLFSERKSLIKFKRTLELSNSFSSFNILFSNISLSVAIFFISSSSTSNTFLRKN